MEPEGEKSKIERLKQRLYEPEGRVLRRNDKESILHEHHENLVVSDHWEEEAPKVEETEDQMYAKASKVRSLLKYVLFFSFLFFVGSAFFAYYVFYGQNNIVSLDKIDLTFAGSNFSAGGEPYSFQVIVGNRNQVPLEDATLLIEYQKGNGLSGEAGVGRVEKKLGNINGNISVNEVEQITLFGKEGDVRNIDAVLSYQVKGSNATYQKKIQNRVELQSPAITFTVTNLKEIADGQTLALTVKVSGRASEGAKRVLVKVDYPTGFEFKSSDKDPISGNNVWDLGDVKQGDDRQIQIKGIMHGQDTEQRVFHIYAGTANSNTSSALDILYNETFATVNVTKAFVDTVLTIDGSTNNNYSVRSSADVAGGLHWENNLPSEITNLEFRLKISGNAFDRRSVTAQDGHFDSTTNTIIWDSTSNSTLATVGSGATGDLIFGFKTIPLTTSSSGVVTDPVVIFDLSVSGRRLGESGVPESVTYGQKRIVKVGSDVGFSGSVAYYSTPFSNRGPFPVVAEKESTVTIGLSIANTANKITGGMVKMSLPSYVKWLSNVAPASEDVRFDKNRNTVTWNVGDIDPGVGVSGKAKTVYFQIAVTPSLSDINSNLQVAGESTFTGTDAYTGGDIRATVRPLRLDTVLDK